MGDGRGMSTGLGTALSTWILSGFAQVPSMVGATVFLLPIHARTKQK